MRMPCPYCGGLFLGIGWGFEKIRRRNGSIDGKEWCRVICRKCSAAGPSCSTEDTAWEAWNSRDIVDQSKLMSHLKLCQKNLKSNRVVCCASCPFEKIIVSKDPTLDVLFSSKRRAVLAKL